MTDPCPTCMGPVRETKGLVCQTCGKDYGSYIYLKTKEEMQQLARTIFPQATVWLNRNGCWVVNTYQKEKK